MNPRAPGFLRIESSRSAWKGELAFLGALAIFMCAPFITGQAITVVGRTGRLPVELGVIFGGAFTAFCGLAWIARRVFQTSATVELSDDRIEVWDDRRAF